MIVDLEQSERAELPDYDLCIVGSGPAGATVARELSDSGLRICVLESGRLKPTPHADGLRRVLCEGIQIKEYSRERVLGGSSTTWAGLSSPLDPIDFEARSYLPCSGWPIAREELLPYWKRAAERYRFPSLELFEPEGFGALRSRGDAQPEWKRIEEKVFLAAAVPQDFGREQRGVYESREVDLYLDATLVRLEGDPAGGRVASAVVRCSSGRELGIRAGRFVLAAGGIENARILLGSRDLCPQGLGNERDQVGRHLMNHPKNYGGLLRLARPLEELPYYFGCLHRGFAGYAGLRLDEGSQRERGLLNSYVRLEPLYPWSDNQGIEALVLLVKKVRLALGRLRSRAGEKVVSMRDWSETGDDSDLQNERKTALGWAGLALKIAVNAPRVAQYLYFRLIAKPCVRTVRLRNFMEMAPNPENRVTLSEERDANDQPVPLVRHGCSELDRRSLIELHRVLAREVAEAGLGELDSDLPAEGPWPIDLDASHHLGATRMGTDPESSVVDPQCKLHGVANVYLAGGSVFPTSGCANPTFTIVALAIRLAEHLRGGGST